MTETPMWFDALNDDGTIAWERLPFPRVCVPIVMPFPSPTSEYDRVANERYEAIFMQLLATGRKPDIIELALAVIGPLGCSGSGFPPAPLRRRAGVR